MIIPKHQQKPGNPKMQTIGPSLLQSHRMEVGHNGTGVYLEIGGHRLDMEYPDAIKLSQLLRMHGKQAKKWAGDSGKHYLTEAVLTDAELNYKRGW